MPKCDATGFVFSCSINMLERIEGLLQAVKKISAFRSRPGLPHPKGP
jgi:hypothetical protein